jgi:predicted lysophospholipase L1 biosynthesis ABC-type transport system permease subunit
VARLYDGILQNLRAIPGVTAAGATTNLPWSGYDENTGFGIVGRPDSPDMGSRYQGATPGYFEATRMHLLDGRFFDPVQDAFRQPAHLIVNDALARRFFPDGKAVGSSLKLGGNTASIVGVVTGIPDSPSDLQVKPAFWFPLEQSYEPTVYFAVRVRDGVDPASLRRAVTDAVHAADSELALSDIRTLEARTAAALAARRFALLLFQAFAVLALMLAGAGIYALLAYIVEQRSKESGIRVALGATPASLCALVLGDCLKMAAAGGILCAILIPAGGRFIQSFLFNVKALDPITLAAVPAILLLVAMLASLGPARSAMRTDPASALRND